MLAQATRRLHSKLQGVLILYATADCKLAQSRQRVQGRQPATSTEGGGDKRRHLCRTHIYDKRRDTRGARRKQEETREETRPSAPDQAKKGEETAQGVACMQVGARSCMRASLR